MTAEVVIETVEFQCVPWVMRNGGTEIQPVQGTWTLAPFALRQRMGVKGVVSCARCAAAVLVEREAGEPGDRPIDRVLPALQCTQCRFVCRAVLLDWDRRKLYCAAYETAGPNGEVIPHKEYLHAESVADATAQFWAGHPADDRITNVVGIAPVLGFFVTDNQGKKLEV